MSESVLEERYSSFEQNKPNGVTKTTKASFMSCPVSDRLLFRNANCIVPVSIMGSKEHEGNRFLATMKLVNASFKSCTLLVGDGLHRHTLKIKHPEASADTLYKMALQAGDGWMLRNKMAYENLTIPHTILRWNSYIEHPDFEKWLKVVSDLYDTDEDYRKAFEENGYQYLKRCSSREHGVRLDEQKVIDYCIIYLKEECAAMCVWADQGYHFEVYPTGRCVAMDATYRKIIEPLYAGLLKPVGIRFKK